MIYSTMNLEDLMVIAQQKIDTFEPIEQELMQAILNKIKMLRV